MTDDFPDALKRLQEAPLMKDLNPDSPDAKLVRADDLAALLERYERLRKKWQDYENELCSIGGAIGPIEKRLADGVRALLADCPPLSE